MSLTPGGADVPRYNRAVLGRAVRYMARPGITQFLDLGAGLPTAQNTHEVAQAEAPDARVAYVDNASVGGLWRSSHRAAVVSSVSGAALLASEVTRARRGRTSARRPGYR